MLFKASQLGEAYRTIMCREFLDYQPAKYLATLAEINAEAPLFVDLLVAMASHSDFELRYRFLEQFLIQLPKYMELDPPMSSAVQAVLTRLGANLLSFSALSEEAMRKNVRFSLGI